jgi:hypothetical protein
MKAKYNSLRTSLFFSALLLSVGAASADVGRCSTANGAGGWGFTVTGTNTSGGPDAIVGNGTVDATGYVALTQTEVTDGEVRPATLKGNVTVNPDCTAKLTVKVYDPSGKLVVTATWAMVFVDNQREIRGILTSLVLPNGSSAPLPVQTLNAKMKFRRF